jgi:hypothetical protein
VVVLYGRPECHLCEVAREKLDTIAGSPPAFRVEEVNIETDEDLHAAYLERIPVIAVDGEIAGELVIDADSLRARLDTLLT